MQGESGRVATYSLSRNHAGHEFVNGAIYGNVIHDGGCRTVLHMVSQTKGIMITVTTVEFTAASNWLLGSSADLSYLVNEDGWYARGGAPLEESIECGALALNVVYGRMLLTANTKVGQCSGTIQLPGHNTEQQGPNYCRCEALANTTP